MKKLFVLLHALLAFIGISSAQNPSSTSMNTRKDTGPNWSNDNSILFSSTRSGQYEIHNLDMNNNKVKRETKMEGDQHYPAISPDGKWIAFASKHENEKDIYIKNIATDEFTNLTQSQASEGDDYMEWSLDSKKIYFKTDIGGDPDIYSIDISSREINPVIVHKGYDMSPSLSKTGNKLLFASNRTGTFNIYVLDLASSTLLRLTDSEYDDMFPNWSEDDKVYFARRMGMRNSEIMELNLNTNELTNISNTSEVSEFYPRISEDGKSIIYMSAKDGDSDIYLMNLKNGLITNLTEDN